MNWLESLEARRQAWWLELAPREQRITAIGAVLVICALLWWVALAPALRTLATARSEHPKLDAQMQQMLGLQLRARAAQGQPRANRDDALRALEASVRQNLGPNAQMQSANAAAGEGVTVAVRAAPADALALWFAQARGNARAVPREIHITRSTQSTPASASAPASSAESPQVRWDGTLVMSLPAR